MNPKYLLYIATEADGVDNTLHQCFEDLCDYLDNQRILEDYILFADLYDIVSGVSKVYNYRNSVINILITRV